MCYINRDEVKFHAEDGDLKKKLYALIRMSHYQPVQIVEYERIAMVEKKGNVRITFDRNIGGTAQIKTFFDPVLPCVPALPAGQHILEVKYDEFLPDPIGDVINSISLNRISFSKYYFTRKNQMINWE